MINHTGPCIQLSTELKKFISVQYPLVHKMSMNYDKLIE